jgi:hypothetical protein
MKHDEPATMGAGSHPAAGWALNVGAVGVVATGALLVALCRDAAQTLASVLDGAALLVGVGFIALVLVTSRPRDLTAPTANITSESGPTPTTASTVVEDDAADSSPQPSPPSSSSAPAPPLHQEDDGAAPITDVEEWPSDIAAAADGANENAPSVEFPCCAPRLTAVGGSVGPAPTPGGFSPEGDADYACTTNDGVPSSSSNPRHRHLVNGGPDGTQVFDDDADGGVGQTAATADEVTLFDESANHNNNRTMDDAGTSGALHRHFRAVSEENEAGYGGPSGAATSSSPPPLRPASDGDEWDLV